MASSNKHLHITLDERKIIETGIFNGSTRTARKRKENVLKTMEGILA